MLSLDAPIRTIAGVDLAVDDEDPRAFWILPPPPRVALRDGAPQVSLLRLVRDGQLAGGHLELRVELVHPEAALAAARDELARTLGDDRAALRPVTVIGATAELLFVGRETGADGSVGPLLRRAYGAATPLLDPPHTAAFSALLTPDGVRLVEAALRSGGAPLGIAFRLQVEALRPALRVTAHVDWGRVYDHFSSAAKEGWLLSVDDVQQLVEKLVEQRAVRIDVVQAVVPDGAAESATPDLAPALAWVEREIVERCCEPVLPLSREPARASLGTVGELFGVGSSFAMKNLTQIERSTADLVLDRSCVVVRTLGASAHLADLLGASPPDEHIADASDTSPFFARASLHVTTARPLAATFTREVVARFRYGATEVPMQLTSDAPEGNAETWADQSPDRTWTLALEATLADDAPVDPGAQIALPELAGEGRELTLDLERLLGLRAIDVWSAADERVAAARVSIRRLRGDEPAGDPIEVTLTAAAPRVTAWLRGVDAGDRLEATTRYLLTDGRILDLAAVPVATRILRLPPPFPGSMTVQIWSDDDWSELAGMVIALQKREGQPVVTVRLDHAGASAAVSLDLPDPLDRAYRYRVARQLKDDSVEEDAWRPSDHATLLVGRVAADKLVVDVTPLGLELSEAGINTVEVELRYVDVPNRLREVTTAILRARADRFHWEVALQDPAARSYDYQITIHRSSGRSEVQPWVTATDRILPVAIIKAP